MSRASERAAYEKAQAILRRAGASGMADGDEYGAGKLTKAQRKSQERHIPLTAAPRTAAQKIKRSLFG